MSYIVTYEKKKTEMQNVFWSAPAASYNREVISPLGYKLPRILAPSDVSSLGYKPPRI